MFLLTVLRRLPLPLDSLIQNFYQTMPPQVTGLVRPLVEDIMHRSTGTVLSLSALTTLWIASRGFQGLITGLNQIYEIPEKRNYFVRTGICLVYTILLPLVIFLCCLILFFGVKLQELLLGLFHAEDQEFFYSGVRLLISFFALFILFLLLTVAYAVLPAKKQSILRQIPGALFTGLVWGAYAFIYKAFVSGVASKSQIYGSLTTVVLFLLCLHFAVQVFFLGAVLNHYLAVRKEEKLPAEEAPPTDEQR